MSYLLDTTVLLDFAHGRVSAIDLVDRLFSEVAPLYPGSTEPPRLTGRAADSAGSPGDR